MIVANNVFFQYTKEFYILNDICLNIKDNERVALYGKLESGKSTLIRVLAGLETPTKGDVIIKGINSKKIDFENDINLGYIGSKGTFFQNKTVEQNLSYVLKIRKINKDIIQQKVNHALNYYNLDIIKNKKIKDLTATEKIRVCIARLSLRKLDLILIDDIFYGVDKQECKKIVELIDDLVNVNSATLVIATSDLKIIEPLNCRVIYIQGGTIVESLNED